MPATFNIPTQAAVDDQIITHTLWNTEFQNLYDNLTPGGVDDYSATDGEMQTTTDPFPGSVISKPTSMSGELERLRYQLVPILGTTYWYQDPAWIASLDDSATAGATATSLKNRLDQLAAQIKSIIGRTNWYDTATAVLPVGTIVAYSNENTAPTGWLFCDGQIVSRTTYADLFAVISTQFGSGDGSTTFHLPDFRGRFLRGRDEGIGRDPNRLTRTSMNGGGNTGDHVGSIQDDATAVNGLTISDPGHNHSVQPRATGASGSGGNALLSTSGATSVDTTTAQTGIGISGTDSETRPLNAYVAYIIRY